MVIPRARASLTPKRKNSYPKLKGVKVLHPRLKGTKLSYPKLKRAPASRFRGDFRGQELKMLETGL